MALVLLVVLAAAWAVGEPHQMSLTRFVCFALSLLRQLCHKHHQPAAAWAVGELHQLTYTEVDSFQAEAALNRLQAVAARYPRVDWSAYWGPAELVNAHAVRSKPE